jgi:hypothetical protein
VVAQPFLVRLAFRGFAAEAAHKNGRAKADFELREISREEYERIRQLLQL